MLFIVVGILSLVAQAASAGFQLRLLHMNDLHSRFQQVTRHGSKCTQKDSGKCVGGVARVKYKVDQIRNASDDNVLFLMAGDLFQVTHRYSFQKPFCSGCTDSRGHSKRVILQSPSRKCKCKCYLVLSSTKQSCVAIGGDSDIE